MQREKNYFIISFVHKLTSEDVFPEVEIIKVMGVIFFDLRSLIRAKLSHLYFVSSDLNLELQKNEI